jgi:transcriptional regulator with XRE-family HTH domain
MLFMSIILDTQNQSLHDIGQCIRRERKAQKLSQTELGHRAKLSRMPIYRIEAGQDISLRALLSIAAALGQGLQFQPLSQGVPSANALHSAFAHLHEDANQ